MTAESLMERMLELGAENNRLLNLFLSNIEEGNQSIRMEGSATPNDPYGKKVWYWNDWLSIVKTCIQSNLGYSVFRTPDDRFLAISMLRLSADTSGSLMLWITPDEMSRAGTCGGAEFNTDDVPFDGTNVNEILHKPFLLIVPNALSHEPTCHFENYFPRAIIIPPRHILWIASTSSLNEVALTLFFSKGLVR